MKVAPSWSWACQPVFFELIIQPQCNILCRVRSYLRLELSLLEPSISLDGSNPFGRLRKASLYLCGKLASLLTVTLLERGYWYCKTLDNYLVCIEADWNCWESGGVSFKQMAKLKLLLIASCCSEQQAEDGIEEVICKPQYRQTFFQDSELDFKASTACRFCSNADLKRDIWGLLIHPTAKPNTYYRVRAFLCRAEHGGSDVFKDAETKVLDLI